MSVLPISGTVSARKYEHGQCGRCGVCSGDFAEGVDGGPTYDGIWLAEIEGTSLCANCCLDYHHRVEASESEEA